jgi:hypothetical protein
MFRQYHYLNGSLPSTARCYAAVYHDKPIAFVAVVHVLMRARYYRVSRLVVFARLSRDRRWQETLKFCSGALYFSNENAFLHFNKQSSNHSWIHDKLEVNPYWSCKQGTRQHKNKQ